MIQIIWPLFYHHIRSLCSLFLFLFLFLSSSPPINQIGQLCKSCINSNIEMPFVWKQIKQSDDLESNLLLLLLIFSVWLEQPPFPALKMWFFLFFCFWFFFLTKHSLNKNSCLWIYNVYAISNHNLNKKTPKKLKLLIVVL